MSEAIFRLVYDGEALRDGEMDVADLAPALMGIAQLLKASGRVLYGDDGDVSVRVRTMQDGSFDVHLTAVVRKLGSLWALQKSPDAQAAEALLGVLGLTSANVISGAIGVVRALRGARPRVLTSRPGFVRLEVDGISMEVPEVEARLTLDAGVRAALERVIVDPLDREGIDTVSFGAADPKARITLAEAAFFRAPIESDADEFASHYQKAFSIQSLSFKPDRKWRLSDGHGAAKLVQITDAEFEGRVQRNEIRFAKGDILICDVTERSWRTATGFKSEYEISKVLEHRPAPEHPVFDFEGEQ